MKPVFGIIALLLSLLGYVPYIIDIVQRKVKPQRVSWGIWAILSNIMFANQLLNGGGWSVWFFGSTALLVTVIFFLSLSRGVGGSSKMDKIILIAAAVLLVYWLTVTNTRVSTILALVIDAAAVAPSILKAYRYPETESYPQWVMASLGGLFSLFAITKVDYILYLFPLYIIVVNGLVVGAKFYAERYIVKKPI